jgi:thiosulfate dehydrogenase (quinone) large subunit
VSPRTSPEGARRGPSGAPRSGRRRRRVYFGAPPPKALVLSGWALVPLRAFLGVTFCFAGLQKLANPNFFNANSPSGIQAQLIASVRTSPLHQLLGHLLGLAGPIGIVIALAELAVGLGTILGLWTRVAAAGGMLLSVTLFLTVSFHTSPYYTGADIVFVFAWIPLVLAGSGGVLSLDGLIAARVAGEYDLGSPTVVPIRFALVQQVCGHYENDSCRAQSGRRCTVHGCPFLSAETPGRRSAASGSGLDAVDRRTVVVGGATVLAAAVAGGVVAGTAAGLGRAVGGTTSPQSESVTLRPPRPGASSVPGSGPTTTAPESAAPTTTTTAPESAAPTTTTPPGTPIGLASDVPVGGSASFTDPKSGDPGLVLQLTKGRFVAYDAICPHAGCTVGYSSAAKLIVCPCHGSEFDPNTGAVVNPPAQRGLSSIQVAVDASGELVIEA